MSEKPPRPRPDSMPSIVWGLLGVLAVALFVLAFGILNHVG